MSDQSELPISLRSAYLALHRRSEANRSVLAWATWRRSRGWADSHRPPTPGPPANLIKDPAEAIRKLRLLYVACGDNDNLLRISEGVHKMLEDQKVPHFYNVIPGGRHDFKVWKSDLYHFSQLLFREKP